MRLTFEKTTENKSEELISKKQPKSKKQITIFIQLSAWGAYLIFGLSEWALIRGGYLFEVGRQLSFHHFQKVKTSLCNKKINKNTDLVLHQKIQFCISDTF